MARAFGKYEYIILGLDAILLLLIVFGALNFISFAIILMLVTTVLFIQKISMEDQIEELSDKYDSLSKIFFSRIDDISKKIIELKIEISKKLIEIGNRLSSRLDEDKESYENEMRSVMGKIITVENRITDTKNELGKELDSQKLRLKRIEFELGLTEDEHIGE